MIRAYLHFPSFFSSLFSAVLRRFRTKRPYGRRNKHIVSLWTSTPISGANDSNCIGVLPQILCTPRRQQTECFFFVVDVVFFLLLFFLFFLLLLLFLIIVVVVVFSVSDSENQSLHSHFVLSWQGNRKHTSYSGSIERCSLFFLWISTGWSQFA